MIYIVLRVFKKFPQPQAFCFQGRFSNKGWGFYRIKYPYNKPSFWMNKSKAQWIAGIQKDRGVTIEKYSVFYKYKFER